MRKVETLVDGFDAHLMPVMVDAEVTADLLGTPPQLELGLNEGVQPHIRGELGSAAALRERLGVLVRSASLIVGSAPRSAQFSANRRWVAFEPSSYIPDTLALLGQCLNPLTLEQRQIPSRDCRAGDEIAPKATILLSPTKAGSVPDPDVATSLNCPAARCKEIPVQALPLYISFSSSTSHRNTLHSSKCCDHH